MQALNKTILGIYLLAFCFVFGAPAFPAQDQAEVCESSLNKFKKSLASPTEFFQDREWLQVYENAKERNDTRIAAIALANLIERHANDLKLGAITSHMIKNYRAALMYRQMHKVDPEAAGHSELAQNLRLLWPELFKEFAGFIAATPNAAIYQATSTHDSLGNERTRPYRIASFLKQYSLDFLWSNGPFGFRLLTDVAFRAFTPKMMRDLEEKIFANFTFLSEAGISNDMFFMRMWREYFSSPAEIKGNFTRMRRGILTGPFKIFMVLRIWATFTGVHLHPLDAMESAQAAIYQENDFFRDSSRLVYGDLSHKRVSYIADADMVNAALPTVGRAMEPVGQMDPLQLSMVEPIRRQSGSFHQEVVHNYDELRRALESQRDADVVFLNFHGNSGNFWLNGSPVRDHILQMPLHALKNGAVIVFVSCQVGNRYLPSSPFYDGEAEPWIEFSRRLLPQQGSAVASTQSIGFFIEAAPNRRMSIGQQISYGLSPFIVVLNDFVHRGFTSPRYTYLVYRMQRGREFESTGLRVFDAATGNTVYHMRRP